MKYKTVYFMRPVGMEGPIKIGCTTDVDNRLSTLSVWSPFPLEVAASVPGGIGLERSLHAYFWDHHTHKEWFRPCPELLALVEGIRAGRAISDLISLEGVKLRRCRNWTAEDSKKMSYHARLRHAAMRAGRSVGTLPNQVQEVMWEWSSRRNCPSDEGFRLLDRFIADPHSFYEKEAA